MGKPLSKRRRRQLIDLVLLGSRIAAAALGAIAVHHEHMVGFLFSAGAFGFLQMHRHRRDRAGMSTKRRKAPKVENVEQVVLRVPQLGAAEASIITRAITNPPGSITRIKERLVPLTRALDVESDYWLRITVPAAAASVRFPILTPNKGQLLDNFSVRSADGAELPTVTFEESIGLVVACLDKLASLCGEQPFADYLSDVRDEVVGAISRRGRDGDGTANEFLAGRLAGVLGTSPHANLAVVLASELMERYAIFVELPVAGLNPIADADADAGPRRVVELVVKTSRRTIQQRAYKGWMSYLRRSFGDVVGVRDNTFLYPVEQAARTASYHLEFLGPEGTYLAEQKLLVDKGRRKPYRYRRFRSRLGQRYAHVYIRGGRPRIIHAKARVTFFERPPGSIGPATIAALASLVGIYATSRVALRPGEDHRSDAVALLVALPGLASGVLGLERSNSILGGVLVARITSVLTFSLSCTAIVFFYVGHVPEWTGIHLSRRDGWTVILTASAMTWAMAASSWIRRSALYTYVTKKPMK